MKSRGFLYSLGDGTRRSLALFWALLLVSSLLLQYASLAAPQAALAVHDEGLFELDGNAVSGAAIDGDDWDKVYGGSSSASSTRFITDPVDDNADESFTGGSTKDDLGLGGWLWKSAKASQAKNDITNAFAAAYGKDGDTFAYFGLNKWEADGDNFVGFWFFKDAVGTTGDGNAPGSPFSGSHSVGDILILADYTNGGSVASFNVYKWVGSGGNVNGTLQTVATGIECGGGGSDDACGTTNGGTVSAPWPFNGRDGAPGEFPAGTFFEGGLNLTALNLDSGCFTSFLAETRSSQSVDATLSDFALGRFSFCVAPDIHTQVQEDGQDVQSINKGESVTDHATLTGSKGVVQGTVKFFVCGPDTSGKPDCTNGGDKVGATKTLNGGEADSDSFTPTALGSYCFRVEYTAAAGSKYVDSIHTNQSSECFRVIPADVKIHKTAGPSPVSAGDPISFTIDWGNAGEGKATGVVVSDDLPGKAGLDWSIDSFTGTGSTCGISGATGSQVLTCDVGPIPGNTAASGSVTVVSDTTKASCGKIDNTGDITSANDGSGSSSADVTVQCPDIKVVKNPDAGDDGSKVSAGDTATFTIKVENLGPGDAKGVSVSDDLPGTLHWTESEADCSIAGADGSQVLTCDVGPLAAGASKTYSVSAETSKADCGTLDNTGSASATNEPSSATDNNSDTGAIEVLCADIQITKKADKDAVTAGDQIGFTITVKNDGTGTAKNVAASDTLDAAFDWSIASQDGGWTLTGNDLEYSASSLAAGASSSVHVVATSDAESCRLVPNTATVSAGNDGSDEASASLTIQCPDVHVAKDPVATPISAGDTAAFKITVSNDGQGIARDVTLTDTLPTGIAWTDDSDACDIAAGVLSCDFGDLAPGAKASVTISGETDAADCGNVHNTAVVAASNESAADQLDNTDDATVVVDCPDVHVAKDPVATPISAGDTAAFKITVSNDGQGIARDVTLTDTLPTGIAWTDDSDACDIAAGVLSCDFGDLAPGAKASVTISGETDAADCGNVHNTAVVAASNESAADQLDNTDDATVVVDCPDVHVAKDPVATPISAGDTAAFKITVSNDGQGIARDVTLTDTLPTGIAWTDDSDACDIAAGVLSCDFGDLAPGAKASVTISGETDACANVHNSAVVAASNESAKDAEDNTDDATVVVDCPEMLLIKTPDAPLVSAGEDIGFTITVTNNGDGVAKSAKVSDPLPANAGTGWSIDQDPSRTDPGWTIDAGVLNYGPADLASGASVKVHIVSGTTAATCGQVDNTATVTTTNDGGDDDTSHVTVQCPDVRVLKTADNSPILAGQTASFTIKAWNDGPGTAFDVVVTDQLPSGIAWTDDSDSCDIDGGVLTCKLGTLGPDDDAFSVTISGPSDAESCADIPNAASVEASNEPAADTGNNTSRDQIDVQCASIDLVKTAGNAADGDTLHLSQPGDVVFTYVVTNTSTATLEHIVLVDDNATPGDTADDVTVVCLDANLAPKTTLAPGESMTCKATMHVGVGTRTNVAKVTANPEINPEQKVSDTDDAVVQVPEPEVTPTPRLTPPPTSTLDEATPAPGGNGLLLVLLSLAGIMLTIGYLTPARARARRRR